MKIHISDAIKLFCINLNNFIKKNTSYNEIIHQLYIYSLFILSYLAYSLMLVQSKNIKPI